MFPVHRCPCSLLHFSGFLSSCPWSTNLYRSFFLGEVKWRCSRCSLNVAACVLCPPFSVDRSQLETGEVHPSVRWWSMLTYSGSWREGSAVKSAYRICRGPELGSQHPHPLASAGTVHSALEPTLKHTHILIITIRSKIFKITLLCSEVYVWIDFHRVCRWGRFLYYVNVRSSFEVWAEICVQGRSWGAMWDWLYTLAPTGLLFVCLAFW